MTATQLTQRDGGAAAPPGLLPSLTGLRFVAAGLVVGYHLAWQHLFADQGAQQTVFSLFSQGGWTGVGIFFVLSGFLLTWSARSADRVTGFWWRRVVKIFPNHLVTLVAAVLLLALVTNAAVDRSDTVANLFLVHSWFPSMTTRFSGNPVAWSLSCEALFYLAFPALLAAIRRIRPERLWAWTVGVVAAIAAVPAVATLLPAGPRFPVTEFTPWEMWFVYQFPPVRMLDFVVGILLARIVLTGRRLPFGLGGAVAVAVGAYFVAPLFPRNVDLVAVTVLPVGLVIAAAAVADTERRRTWLSGPVATGLGKLSYAFYLWQFLVLTYGHEWLGGPTKSWGTPGALGVAALLLAVTLGLAALQYVLVERPLVRLASERSRRRRAAAIPPIVIPPVTGLPPAPVVPIALAPVALAPVALADLPPALLTPADPPALLTAADPPVVLAAADPPAGLPAADLPSTELPPAPLAGAA